MNDLEPIDVYIPADAGDPRDGDDLPDGVLGRRGAALHPDDLTVIDGIPVTSLARTLIDVAEVADRKDLRGMFENARDRGLLDLDELAAARGRVEWRPSLATLDEVIAEFS